MIQKLLLSGLLFVGCAGAVELTQSSSVDQVLDALDQRGHDLKSLTADIAMADIDPNLGDKGTTHTGKLYFQDLGDGKVRFRILFDKKLSGKTSLPQKHDYVYANGTFTDRDYDLKQQNTRQVLKPGEKMQIFKLDGPFPLPLGQNKDDVHKIFEVVKVASAADDPANTIHLQLLPHAGTEMAKKFEKIDLWLDPQTDFPARIKTLDASETSLKETDLTNVQVNPPMGDKQFQMEDVNLKDGWNAKSD